MDDDELELKSGPPARLEAPAKVIRHRRQRATAARSALAYLNGEVKRLQQSQDMLLAVLSEMLNAIPAEVRIAMNVAHDRVIAQRSAGFTPIPGLEAFGLEIARFSATAGAAGQTLEKLDR